MGGIENEGFKGNIKSNIKEVSEEKWGSILFIVWLFCLEYDVWFEIFILCKFLDVVIDESKLVKWLK